MGGQLSKVLARVFGTKEMRILMLGLDAAGKTTILYQLKLDQAMTTIPTVGFNVETVRIKNIKFNVWDVGGQDKIRPLWRHYYTGTQGLIFVVDSSDRARLTEAKGELRRVWNDDEMKNAVLLVFANKQDIPGAMSEKELKIELELEQSERPSKVCESTATTGKGIIEGMEWLSNKIEKANAPKGNKKGGKGKKDEKDEKDEKDKKDKKGEEGDEQTQR